MANCRLETSARVASRRSSVIRIAGTVSPATALIHHQELMPEVALVMGDPRNLTLLTNGAPGTRTKMSTIGNSLKSA